jgi:predicted esterase
MKPTRNDGYGGQGVTYLPASGSYSNVVVWMHGLGDTADGWASMMPSLNFQNTKFILPTATRLPISLNMGMSMPAWSDIYGLEDDDPEDAEGFTRSASRINAIIQGEIDKGIDPKKIIVGGFSQGGALALHVTLRSAHSLGGCVALSTWLALRANYPANLSPAATALPILQVHGDEDSVVGYEWGKASHNLLKEMISNPSPVFTTIPDMGHSSDPEEIREVKKFMQNIFGDA